MAGTALGIDGLISGLDTTSLINQLMQIEAGPQTLLKAKQSTASGVVAALQSLNVKVASLATAATKAATPGSWQVLAASSSAASVTATATGTSPTQLTFTVDGLAAAQVSVTPAPVTVADLTGASVPPTMQLRSADGTLTVVSLDGVTDVPAAARAITASAAGVVATAVQVAPGSYRLQLSSATPGAAGAFTASTGVGDPITLASVSAAQDAQVTLWPGSGAPQVLTSSSNAFTDAVPGVAFTVSALEATPVTVTTRTDLAAPRQLAADLVSNLSLVLSEVTSRTTSTTTTDATGTRTTPGVLSGQSAVRSLSDQLAEAASYPVTYNGELVSPSGVGISIDRYGAISFDPTVFDAAYAADPVKVQAVVSGVSDRVAAVARSASDTYDGTLTRTITSQQAQVKDLGDRIADWDDRLEVRRQALQATYSALETSLAALQSQSSWLSQQLASLPTYSSSTK